MKSTSDKIKDILVSVAGTECYKDEAPKSAKARHIVWKLMPPKCTYGDNRRDETVTRAAIHIYDSGDWPEQVMSLMEDDDIAATIVGISYEDNQTYTIIEVEAV